MPSAYQPHLAEMLQSSTSLTGPHAGRICPCLIVTMLQCLALHYATSASHRQEQVLQPLQGPSQGTSCESPLGEFILTQGSCRLWCCMEAMHWAMSAPYHCDQPLYALATKHHPIL